MDAYQQQQRYMRPPQPPPSASDPYQHYQQHQQRPPVPQQGTWYSNQFQYQPPPPSHSPSPPPPPHHWAPPPPASAYPPPPPPSHPYPPHLPPQNHHFPPRPHAPPPPPPQQQSYAQDWGNTNWGQQQQHQAWDYSAAHNNAEDWAAKARAWAAAKQVAAEEQHPPPQFSRPEEQQTHYYNQYHPQTVDHYQDVQQQQAFPAPGYQQFPTAASAPPPPPPHQASMAYTQETAQSSYTPEGQASTAGSFVHQQEVPSSYSSVTGKAETANQHEQLNKPLPLPIPQAQEMQLHLQPPLPTTAKPVLAEEPFAYGNHAADPTPDLSDQPLQFATGFSHNHDPHMQSSFTGHHDSTGSVRGIGPSTSVPSVNSWTPAVTSGAVYPQMSSVLSTGPQHDPSVAVPSPASAHASLAFGSFPGSNFQPAIPPTGMPYGLGAGPALPSAAGFPGDTYGVSNVSERPKKASVPNWLKEEIIKKASVMTRPALEHSPKETQSFEDEGVVDKSFGKSDLTDGKSIDSSRSTEEDEDDEDSAEAARSAAINQEIKRILTEVLLKVTDELFDEIATKVLDEDNLTVEGEHSTMPSSHEVSPSAPAVSAPKASAKVLIPVKANESETEESSSGSAGNVLGLVNYASDEDDEIQSNNMSNSRKSSELQQPMKVSEGMHGALENGISQLEHGERSKEANLEFGVRKTSSVGSNNNLNASMSELGDRENSSKLVPESKDVNSSVDGSKRLGGKNGSQLKATPEDAMMESEPLSENSSRKKLVADDSEAREMRTKSSQDSRHESRSHSAKDFVEAESRTGADEKADHHHHRHDERHQRKEKKDDRNGSKDKKNERPGGAGEKGRESESQKRTSRLDSKKDRKEAEDSHRRNAKEDTGRKRERAKDKDEDRARHKLSSDSSKHKRRRSSSISSDETSHDSKRKQHSRKRHSSPSPVRQVSRSPHSKHSERRHSPYSSLESNRGRRSRSKSPRTDLGGEKGKKVILFAKHVVPLSAAAMRAGLWWVWLYGLILILFSLYATQRLPWVEIKKTNFNYHKTFIPSSNPDITIFSAPASFSGSVGASQILAIRSWLALSPQITVVLFSQDPSVVSFAAPFGSQLVVDSGVDFTFLGTPFFHSMVERSREYATDVSVFVSAQTVLLPNLVSAINYAYKLDRDWLLVASVRNISHFPFQLDGTGKRWINKDGKRMRIQQMQEILGRYWQWNRCQDKVLMAWNSRDQPLHNGVFPPFLYGKGVHNQWLISEAASSGLRFVFDASWTISGFSLNDDEPCFHQSISDSIVSDIEDRSWECAGNSHLGAVYGSFLFHTLNHSNLAKLLKCGGRYIFHGIPENIVYPLGYGSPWNSRALRFWTNKKTAACVDSIRSQKGISNCAPRYQLNSSRPLGLPFSMESLLSMAADKNRTVILAIAGYSYKDMLMSWVCRLRQLKVRNFVVCALDHETYQFSILQGLPVFYDPSAPRNISFDDCHFGTKCFQRVTKVKSRMVLNILKLGYNVLLSDVDVYWFHNPLPMLYSFGHAVLVAQSDEYNITGPINLPRRLNSGFYFAHSDSSTIAAMEKVVKHAATSGLSEQPSFYDTLCGEGGSYRISNNRCLERETNLTIHFLDRNLFPNGAYLDLWQKKDVRTACIKKGCLILHNNWISGRLKKLERQVLSGLWEYDNSRRMCLQRQEKDDT
ncbi:hypothetical protein Tsubulata_028573 [Turnera subulata]|uniref:Nucleotide-diphospho-sugar transferase domain-containing protein n=1 Tax=Turnera subulata TaxID=218843 RepID=A0A9Q0F1T4_9ROSI|nr:hypothetical protein Tsubulata_028573 [Turnera subulata]